MFGFDPPVGGCWKPKLGACLSDGSPVVVAAMVPAVAPIGVEGVGCCADELAAGLSDGWPVVVARMVPAVAPIGVEGAGCCADELADSLSDGSPIGVARIGPFAPAEEATWKLAGDVGMLDVTGD